MPINGNERSSVGVPEAIWGGGDTMLYGRAQLDKEFAEIEAARIAEARANLRGSQTPPVRTGETASFSVIPETHSGLDSDPLTATTEPGLEAVPGNSATDTRMIAAAEGEITQEMDVATGQVKKVFRPWFRWVLVLGSLIAGSALAAAKSKSSDANNTEASTSGTDTVTDSSSDTGDDSESETGAWFDLAKGDENSPTEITEEEESTDTNRVQVESDDSKVKRLTEMYNRTLELGEYLSSHLDQLTQAIENKNFAEVERLLEGVDETVERLNLENLSLNDEGIRLNPDIWQKQTRAINAFNSMLWANRESFEAVEGLKEKSDKTRKNLREARDHFAAVTEGGMNEGEFSTNAELNAALFNYLGQSYETPSSRLMNKVEEALKATSYSAPEFGAMTKLALQEFLISQNCLKVGRNDGFTGIEGALKRFQSANNIPKSGKLDAATVNKIKEIQEGRSWIRCEEPVWTK